MMAIGASSQVRRTYQVSAGFGKEEDDAMLIKLDRFSVLLMETKQRASHMMMRRIIYAADDAL